MSLAERSYKIDFTKNEKKVIDFLIEYADEACFMSSTAIAKRLEVSDSTVIRTVKRLGFGNFSKFKIAYQKEISEKKIFPINNEMFENLKTVNANSEEDLIESTRKLALQHIINDSAMNDSHKYIQTAQLLSKAENVYVCGFRTFSGLAHRLGSLLNISLNRVHIITASSYYIDALSSITDKDVIIIISYFRYSINAEIVSEMARDTGCKIVVLTDKFTAPVTKGASVVIVNDVNNMSFSTSMVGISLSIDIISNLVSRINKEAAEEKLKKLDRYLHKTGQY